MSARNRRFRKVDPRGGRGGKGTPIGVGSPTYSSAVVLAPPELRPGQVRCPVCRNATGLTPLTKVLRKHRDLFGEPCWNKSQMETVKLVAPPVVLPRGGGQAGAEPAVAGQSRLDGGSLCTSCGKWLPGERTLCGRCFALGGTS